MPKMLISEMLKMLIKNFISQKSHATLGYLIPQSTRWDHSEASFTLVRNFTEKTQVMQIEDPRMAYPSTKCQMSGAGAVQQRKRRVQYTASAILSQNPSSLRNASRKETQASLSQLIYSPRALKLACWESASDINAMSLDQAELIFGVTTSLSAFSSVFASRRIVKSRGTTSAGS